jgi:serine/threonine-protein kinase
MLAAPIPADEQRRLALLEACHIMYTPAEQAFDDIARLAADLCGTEIALITLVDSDYQWFKARVGVEQTGTARDLSFCGHCIVGRQPLVVPDTHLDPRFADNPLVTGAPNLRFYTGVPLVVDGLGVGALSVADRSPRTLTAQQLDALQRLAAQISRELRLRRDLDNATKAGGPGARTQARGIYDLAIGPGAVIGGRWLITREIGRGGAGIVFEAHDPENQRAAIKVLFPIWASIDKTLGRFAREARVLMRLTSPHVGKLYDVGNLDAEQGGLPYLLLEFLEGSDLGHVIEQRGRVLWREAFSWCADAADAVAEVHDLGVVHRDLKPSNIFLAGIPPVVKVLDFGIAAGDPESTDAKLTADDDVFGSPSYMSPEQMMGTAGVDGRSDVWSMGACLYELITGSVPFPGKSPFEIFASAQSRPPAPLVAFVANLPSEVQSLVGRCLRRQRDERPTMRALAEELRSNL